MNEFEKEVLRFLGHILKELRGQAVDAAFQEPEPAPKREQKKPSKKSKVGIGADLEGTFTHEIFQYIEVQDNGNRVQIIQFIGYGDEDKKKWRALNGFLRDAGYKYHPVEDGLGYWAVS